MSDPLKVRPTDPGYVRRLKSLAGTLRANALDETRRSADRRVKDRSLATLKAGVHQSDADAIGVSLSVRLALLERVEILLVYARQRRTADPTAEEEIALTEKVLAFVYTGVAS